MKRTNIFYAIVLLMVLSVSSAFADDTTRTLTMTLILKDFATVTTAPSATNPTYTGEAQNLVTAGEADGGTMLYALGSAEAPEGSYSAAIPQGTDDGTYYVWYMVSADADHRDSSALSLDVTISKATPTLTAPTAKTGLKYTGSAQELITAGSAQNGTLYYVLGDNATTAPTDGYVTAIPTATDEGTYYIWYRVSGDAHYNDIAAECVQVTIELESYTISYSLQGGTATGNPTSYTMKSNAITLSNPTRTGYTFAGWTGSNGTTPSTSVTIAQGSSGAKSYVANWTAITYTISYNLGGGTLDGSITSYDIETTLTLSQPVRDGYDFAGWVLSGDDSGTVSSDLTIQSGTTGNLEYIAQWTLHRYTLSYDLDGGAASNPTSYTIESSDITLNRPAKAAYDFAGWSFDSYISLDVTIPKGSTGDRTYTAIFTPTTYIITYNLDGGAAANPTSYTIESSDITLNRPAKAAYDFAGWSFDSYISLDVTIPKGSTGDRTYTAIFTPIAYTITYNLDGGAAANPTTYTIESSDITLNIPEKAAYDFRGWSFDSYISLDVTIPKGSTGDRTYTAIFTPTTYTITYNLDGGTNHADNPATYTIDSATIILKTPVREGYDFGGWLYDGEAITEIATGSSGDIILDAVWDTARNTPSENTVVTTAEEISTMDDDKLQETFSNKTDIILTGEVKNLSETIEKLQTVTTIENLDLSDIQGTTEVKLNDNVSVKSINISGNTSIKKVDVTDNTALTVINITNSSVDTIYANGCKSLEEVNAEGSESLVTLQVSETAITSLNVKNCTNLEIIDASGCENLEEVNLEGCESLTYLNVNETRITSLNVQGCESLDVLLCASCDITDLNIEGCENLSDVDVSNNNLRIFNARNLQKLRNLECRHQRIYAQSLVRSMNFNDFLLGRGRFASAEDEEEAIYSENVSNMKAYDVNGIELAVDYDSETGAASFSGEPDIITYDYDTGFENIVMDVTVHAKDDDTDSDNVEVAGPGGSGGGCTLGFGAWAGAVMLLLIPTSKKRY